jgi:hypothetical protein
MRNTTLPTHPTLLDPATGLPLQAIGWFRGRPLWPAMGGSTDTVPPVAPAAVPPVPTPPTAPPADVEPPATGDDKPLGPNGEKALQSERSLRADAEKRAQEALAELEKLKSANQTEQEKALEAARREGRTEVQTVANKRLVSAEVRAYAANAGFQDPKDAVVQLAELIGGIAVTDSGDVDEAAVEAAVKKLAETKPYLLKPTGPVLPAFAPNPGQGQHQPSKPSGGAAGKAEADKRFANRKKPAQS